MTTTLNSLAAFRRFLALPGATAQIIRHDWAGKPLFAAKPEFFEPRKVRKLQTNAVCFDHGERGSWLYWDRSQSNGFHFDGSDIVTVDLNAEKGEIMQYRCWIDEAHKAA